MTDREQFDKWMKDYLELPTPWAAWQEATRLAQPRWIPVSERLPKVDQIVWLREGNYAYTGFRREDDWLWGRMDPIIWHVWRIRVGLDDPLSILDLNGE